MATQAERREATRARLIDTGRQLLLERGSAHTTTRDILAVAGVSRGAMYHHFSSREALLAAVYEAEAAGAIERALAARTPGASHLANLEAACLAWLGEISKPDVARVVAVEGPAALGWERCREIEETYGLGSIRDTLEAADRAGEIDVASVDLAARILNAALTEAALSILRAKRKREARSEAEATLRKMIASFAA